MSTHIDLDPAGRALLATVSGVQDTQLSGSTPCEGRTVGQLIQHLVGLTAAFRAAAAYQFMDGNAALDGNKAHQVNLTLDYSLSKRTDVYTSVTYQRTSGNGAQAQVVLFEPSNGRNQMVLRAGLRHLF